MKIVKSDLYANSRTPDKEVSVKIAVEHSLNGYHADGQLEVLGEKIDSCIEAISIIVECLVNANIMSADQLNKILNYNYEIKD